MEEKYTVYMHISPSGKRYVGMTSKEPKKRWNGGSGYSGNFAFHKEIKELGWRNFKHEILYEGPSEEEAKRIEVEAIKQYETTNPEKGFNCTKGGDYHRVLTPEARARISKVLSAKTRNKRPCRCLETGKVYESAAEAGRDFKIVPSAITQSCRSFGKIPAKGHHFVYTDKKAREELEAMERARQYRWDAW